MKIRLSRHTALVAGVACLQYTLEWRGRRLVQFKYYQVDWGNCAARDYKHSYGGAAVKNPS
jgi:hypothetical protein